MGLVTRGSGLRVGCLERSSRAVRKVGGKIRTRSFSFFFFGWSRAMRRASRSCPSPLVPLIAPRPPSVRRDSRVAWPWGELSGEVYAETCGTAACGTVRDLPDPGGVGGEKREASYEEKAQRRPDDTAPNLGPPGSGWHQDPVVGWL